MFDLFTRLFIKDADHVESEAVRGAYGRLAGLFGIVMNLLLSGCKILFGVLIGAISILSDGLNNLSDAASSLITLLGFKLSSKKPDKEHPFGHGRMEYLTGLLVSALILVVAFQLFKDSLAKVIAGEATALERGPLGYITLALLLLSIGVKFLMAGFNRHVGKKIKSAALSATALDCLSDCISTAVVFLSMLLSLFIPDFPIDGCAGLFVSLFIAYTGIRSVKEIAALLLGQAPDRELVEKIEAYVLSFDSRIEGIHDLVLHDYGPGRKILILHVEVPAEGDILELHDLIDNIEEGLSEEFSCITTIHMDPVLTKSPCVLELKEACLSIVRAIDPALTLHDFRMNEGSTHANLIFDVVVPHECPLSLEEISARVAAAVKAHDPRLSAVVKAEYPFV